MSVTTSQSRIGYTGDGTTVNFPFPYLFQNNADIEVWINNAQVTSGFTTTGASNASLPTVGGNVAFVTAPAAGVLVELIRNPSTLQNTVIAPNDPFPSKTVETMVDAAMLAVQRLFDILALQPDQNQMPVGIAFPSNESNLNGLLPAAAIRALKPLIFDAEGNATVGQQPYQEPATILSEALSAAESAAASEISGATPGILSAALSETNAAIAGIQTPTFQAFVPTALLNGRDFTSGTSNSVTIPAVTGGKVIAGIFMDGVYQSSTQYSVDPTGTIITFSSVIPAGIAEIDVMYYSPGLLGAFIQLGFGAVSRSFQSKMQDVLCVFDFMSPAQISDVIAGTQTLDCTPALTAAVAAAALIGRKLYCPAGKYLLAGTNPITSTTPVSIVGDGKYATLFTTNNIAGQLFSFSGPYVLLEDFGVQVNVKGATTAALLHIFCETENVNRVMFNNYGLGARLGGNVGSYVDCDWLDVGSTSSVGWEVNGYAGGLNIYNLFAYVPTITPTAGIQFLACGGCLITGTNIIRQNNNIMMTPGAGQQVDSVNIVNSFIDSPQNCSLFVQPATGGVVTRVYWCQVECNSSGNDGIFLDGTNGTIDGVTIISLQVMFAVNNGIVIQGANAKNIDIIGGTACGNGASGVNIAGGSGIRVSKVFAGLGYGSPGNGIGIFVGASASGVTIDGCDVNGNTDANIGGTLTGVTITNTSGFVSGFSGANQIAAGNASVTVTHGLSAPPSAESIQLTPLGALSGNSLFLDSTSITSTTFTVRSIASASSNFPFAWRATCTGQI